MNQPLKALSLSLYFSAFCLPVVAQNLSWRESLEGARQRPRVSQTETKPDSQQRLCQTPQQEMEAFNQSNYTYWDARVLASFWNQGMGETKAQIGRKLLWGGQNPALLEQSLQNARQQALQRVSQLTLFNESAYKFQDAEALARLWGDPNPFGAKKWIETKLIHSQEDVVKAELRRTRTAANPAPTPPPANLVTNLVGSRWTYLYRGQELSFSFGPTLIQNFSNGWWKDVSWQSWGPQQVLLWDRDHQKNITLTFDSPNHFSGQDWDGSPVSGNRASSTPVRPPAGLSVSNLRNGEILGSRFNVTGQGVPGSQVLVVVEYPKQDVVSQITGVKLRFQAAGTVARDGNFAIPVNAGEVPRGVPMDLTVSDNANSPALSMRAEKGADNQVQSSPGGVQGPEVFYDRKHNFGLNIPAGWMRVLPGSNEVFKVANGAGTELAVGTDQAKDPRLLVNTLRNELQKKNNRVISEQAVRLGGLSATRLDFANNQTSVSGVVVVCVTGRNQTFVVAAESPNFQAFRGEVEQMLQSFQINSR